MSSQLYTAFTTIQVISALLMIVCVSLQQSDASLGSFSGESTNSIKYTRRGFEKFLFRLTIVTGIIFSASSILTIIK